MRGGDLYNLVFFVVYNTRPISLEKRRYEIVVPFFSSDFKDCRNRNQTKETMTGGGARFVRMGFMIQGQGPY